MASQSALLTLLLASATEFSLAMTLPHLAINHQTGRASMASSRAIALQMRAADGESDVSDADAKRRRAEQLALRAEAAQLEAEALELQVREMQAQSARDAPPSSTQADAATSSEAADVKGDVMALRSPLRWLGPYPAVALSFPALTSPAQKAKLLAGDSVSSPGVTLDFVLDTGANTNTINPQVAGPTAGGGLELDRVGAIAGGVGAGGSLGGGATYMLGSCTLADVPRAERVAFMSGLTATALPVAAPGAAGLLGVAFLDSFAGGVEFVWGTPPPPPQARTPLGESGADGQPSVTELQRPSLTIYGDVAGTEALRDDLCAVELTRLSPSGLPSVTVVVNGVEIPALLDTGAPISVLNAAAAAAASVPYDASLAVPAGASANNPFARFGTALRAGQAAAAGDVLVISGASGPVQLVRSQRGTSLSLGAADFGGGDEDCRVYVGELPGLAALDGLGAAAGPAMVLGTDILRRRPRLWYTPTHVYV